MPKLLIFDDDTPFLSPLTDLRPTFDVRTGALTTLDRLTRVLGRSPDTLLVTEHLRKLVRAPRAECLLDPAAIADEPDLLAVNGRLARPYGLEERINALETNQLLVEVRTEGDLEPVVFAARVSGETFLRILRGNLAGLTMTDIHEPVCLRRPWDAVRLGKPNVADDAELLARGATTSTAPPHTHHHGEHPLVIHPSAYVWPGVVFDTTKGPIVLGERAVVRPGATISGPVVIGEDSQILDHAIVRPNVAAGPFVKLAGEVSGLIVQGYTNKGHDGFVGDSWLGEWVNLGAATTTSNLLNTYGEITSVAQPHARREKTGMQFFGSVIGDHAKTAIDTRLMTGSVVHTGAMWAATQPISGCIEPFSWVTDAGKKDYRMDRFLEVAETVMARREVSLSPEYREAIQVLAERQG